jgi:hypothetical protein
MLKYSLHENSLTERKDDFVAHPHPSASYNREQFIDLMLQRGTTVTRTDIVAVFNAMEETGVYIIENGGTFNLPLMITGFRMPGIYEGALDTFDPTRHSLHATVNRGTLVRDIEKRIKLEKINTPIPQPQILEVKDSVTGSVDTLLTAGGAVEIAGINIKIAGIKPENGVYFVSSGGTETKVETIVSNKPSLLIALVPALPADTYRIKVLTQYSGSALFKDPRTTTFPKDLTIG